MINEKSLENLFYISPQTAFDDLESYFTKDENYNSFYNFQARFSLKVHSQIHSQSIVFCIANSNDYALDSLKFFCLNCFVRSNINTLDQTIKIRPIDGSLHLCSCDACQNSHISNNFCDIILKQREKTKLSFVFHFFLHILMTIPTSCFFYKILSFFIEITNIVDCNSETLSIFAQTVNQFPTFFQRCQELCVEVPGSVKVIHMIIIKAIQNEQLLLQYSQYYIKNFPNILRKYSITILNETSDPHYSDNSLSKVINPNSSSITISEPFKFDIHILNNNVILKFIEKEIDWDITFFAIINTLNPFIDPYVSCFQFVLSHELKYYYVHPDKIEKDFPNIEANFNNLHLEPLGLTIILRMFKSAIKLNSNLVKIIPKLFELYSKNLSTILRYDKVFNHYLNSSYVHTKGIPFYYEYFEVYNYRMINLIRSISSENVFPILDNAFDSFLKSILLIPIDIQFQDILNQRSRSISILDTSYLFFSCHLYLIIYNMMISCKIISTRDSTLGKYLQKAANRNNISLSHLILRLIYPLLILFVFANNANNNIVENLDPQSNSIELWRLMIFSSSKLNLNNFWIYNSFIIPLLSFLKLLVNVLIESNDTLGINSFYKILIQFMICLNSTVSQLHFLGIIIFANEYLNLDKHEIADRAIEMVLTFSSFNSTSTFDTNDHFNNTDLEADLLISKFNRRVPRKCLILNVEAMKWHPFFYFSTSELQMFFEKSRYGKLFPSPKFELFLHFEHLLYNPYFYSIEYYALLKKQNEKNSFLFYCLACILEHQSMFCPKPKESIFPSPIQVSNLFELSEHLSSNFWTFFETPISLVSNEGPISFHKLLIRDENIYANEIMGKINFPFKDNTFIIHRDCASPFIEEKPKIISPDELENYSYYLPFHLFENEILNLKSDLSIFSSTEFIDYCYPCYFYQTALADSFYQSKSRHLLINIIICPHKVNPENIKEYVCPLCSHKPNCFLPISPSNPLQIKSLRNFLNTVYGSEEFWFEIVDTLSNELAFSASRIKNNHNALTSSDPETQVFLRKIHILIEIIKTLMEISPTFKETNLNQFHLQSISPSLFMFFRNNEKTPFCEIVNKTIKKSIQKIIKIINLSPVTESEEEEENNRLFIRDNLIVFWRIIVCFRLFDSFYKDYGEKNYDEWFMDWNAELNYENIIDYFHINSFPKDLLIEYPLSFHSENSEEIRYHFPSMIFEFAKEPFNIDFEKNNLNQTLDIFSHEIVYGKISNKGYPAVFYDLNFDSLTLQVEENEISYVLNNKRVHFYLTKDHQLSNQNGYTILYFSKKAYQNLLDDVFSGRWFFLLDEYKK